MRGEAVALIEEVASVQARHVGGGIGHSVHAAWRREALTLLAGRALSDYGLLSMWGMGALAEQALAGYRRMQDQLADLEYREVLEQFAW